MTATPVSSRPERAAQPARAVRGGALDGLRFLAAMFIVVYHFGASAPAGLEQVSPLFARGWLATDFFLILSGYVLGRAYGAGLDARRIDMPGFVGRRLARVWPGHVVILAGFVALLVATSLVGIAPNNPERFQGYELLAQLGLAHAWGVTAQAGWNEPSWTLSALVVCYVAFPLAWSATRAMSGRARALVAGIALLSAATVASRVVFHHDLHNLPFQLGVFRALPIFLCGLFLARYVDRREPSRALGFALLVSGVGLMAVIQAGPVSTLMGFVSILCLAKIVLGSDQLSTRGHVVVARAADLSFALFISHALSGAVWFGLSALLAERLALSSAWLWVIWALAIPFALGCAVAFQKLLDDPVQAFIKARLDQRREVISGAQPAL